MGDVMTNGAHHPEGGATATTPRPVVKAQAKPAPAPKTNPGKQKAPGSAK